MTDEYFMDRALELAELAFKEDEVPIGAVVVLRGEIIGRGHNCNRQRNDPTMHAEIIAIREAASFLGNERLTECDLFVTKEPCAMCSGAIVHSRIKRLVIATEDIKYGACGTVLQVCGNSLLNHNPQIVFGVKREESRELLQKFFANKRMNKKQG
ncbi:MAG TPA: tRNA adenosine(34) deaminase TadA [Spirochaetota bacterium]|nr:tRNA adenosine(34) deaminase TadA [Spirochaetota bacterium]